MFDGLPVPEQLHHFISSSVPSNPFDPYTISAAATSTANTTNSAAAVAAQLQVPYQHHYHFLFHHHHHQPQVHTQKTHHQHQHHDGSGGGGVGEKQGKMMMIRSGGVVDPDHGGHVHQRPVMIDGRDELSSVASNWSNDEILALLRIRSSLENNWFPEFTWEHVSGKLEELGYKRSAEKCKQKFEEESNNYNNKNNLNNFRFFADQLEDHDIYHHHHHHGDHTNNHNDDQHVITSAHDHTVVTTATVTAVAEDNGGNEGGEDKIGKNLDEADSRKIEQKPSNVEMMNKRKNTMKRKRKFERFKGFCEETVKKLMEQQEEIHNKMLEEMAKRDEEKVAREESLKKEEMDRVNRELEIRAHEQAIASDRQAIIINFLKKMTQSSASTSSTSSSSEYSLDFERRGSNDDLQDQGQKGNKGRIDSQNPNFESENGSNDGKIPTCFVSPPTQNNPIVIPTSSPSATSINVLPQHPSSNFNSSSPIGDQLPQNPNSSPITQLAQNRNSSPITQLPQNPNSSPIMTQLPQNPSSLNTQKQIVTSNDHKDDTGKRWPRDEVIALINLRCSLYNHDHDKELRSSSSSSSKIPLWERISQGMLELGYKRSAKRCKEKWENINKYFRKTKDNVSKKRSLDSRTCPYFHQLSSLYNQGTLISSSSPTASDGMPGNRPSLQENHPEPPEKPLGCSSNAANMHVLQGEKNLVETPAVFDFGF